MENVDDPLSYRTCSMKILFCVILVIAGALSMKLLLESSRSLEPKVPLAGKEFGNAYQRRRRYKVDALNMLETAYHKVMPAEESIRSPLISLQFSDVGIFRINTLDGGETHIVSPRLWPEIAKRREDEVFPARDKFFQSKYVGDLFDDPLLYTLIAATIPVFDKYLVSTVTRVQESLQLMLGMIDDQDAEVAIEALVNECVHHVVWEFALGQDYNVDSTISQLGIAYQRTRKRYQIRCGQFPKWMLSIIARWFPETKHLKKLDREAAEILAPFFLKHDDAKPTETETQIPLQWIRRRLLASDHERLLYATRLLLNYDFAACQSASPILISAILDLACKPEYHKMIREEVKDTWPENQASLTPVHLNRMVVLDSFLKESHRFHPSGAINLMRWILKPLRLSNGILLPAGTLVEAPLLAANMDPSNIEDPRTFDGLRYYKLRMQDPAQSTRYQFGVTTAEDLSFGYGFHRCPGGRMANFISKIIIREMLQEYDITYPPEIKERYPSRHLGEIKLPDSAATIVFTRRANAGGNNLSERQ